MDEINTGILKDLTRNCRISYRDLARKYGLTANAIKNRIDNMVETGVISGYNLGLSSATRGAHVLWGEISADGSQDERAFTDRIGEISTVNAAAAYTNGTYYLVAEYKEPSDMLKLGSHLRALPGVLTVELHPLTGDRGGVMDLSPLHLRVIKAMRTDPSMSIVELSEMTGLSARRARKLLHDMFDARVLTASTRVKLGAASDIPFIARIEYLENADGLDRFLTDLQKEHGAHLWQVFVSASEPVVFILLFADGLTQVDNLIHWIREHEITNSVIGSVSIHHRYFPGLNGVMLDDMLKDVKLKR